MLEMNSPDTPLVSVIIPAYNAEAFIASTLQSVLAQTYRNLDVIVVDDGSCDRTVEVVQQFVAMDERVRLLQQPNGGVSAARNLAIAHSHGEFVAPVDADDIWYPRHVEQQVRCFQSGDASLGLVYSWSVDIDETDALLGTFRASEIQGNVFTTLVCHNFLGNASASMMRRSCLDRVGLYDSGLRAQQAQGCEDWDLYLRLAEHFTFGVVSSFTVGYRKLSGSMSGDYRQMARSHAVVMQSIRQRHPDLPALLFRFSSSSLYFYFAHQSHRLQKHGTTLYWLQQAVIADPVSCWIRLSLYRLPLQVLWCWIRSRLFPAVSQSHAAAITLADIEQRQGAITLVVGLGNRLHQFIKSVTDYSVPSTPTLVPTSDGGRS